MGNTMAIYRGISKSEEKKPHHGKPDGALLILNVGF